MLNTNTPFLLTALEIKKGGVMCVEYELDTGTGYQAMYMEFDPNVQILDETRISELNDRMHNLCLHVNHFINNVPHGAMYEQLQSLGYSFSPDAGQLIDEALAQQKTAEPAPFVGFPENYFYYSRLEAQLSVRKLAFSPLQSTVTLRATKATVTPYSEFGGQSLTIDLAINLHGEFHGGGGKSLDYIFHEALVEDLKPIQDLCQWFVDNAMTIQARQLDLFQFGEYVNRNVPADTGSGFSLTDDGGQPEPPYGEEMEDGFGGQLAEKKRKKRTPSAPMEA